MKTIVVQVSDRSWTLKAMHLACSTSRGTGFPLVLLMLSPVKNPGLLGSEAGLFPPSPQEYDLLQECDAVAEDYGLQVTVQPMQYDSRVDALAQAADYLHAALLFAPPSGAVSLLGRFQSWNLRRQLAHLGCQLHTLETEPQSENESQPMVQVRMTS